MDHHNGSMETRLSADRAAAQPPVAAQRDWLWDLGLILILLVGALLRFTGLDWDQNQHLHPDERFLTMVATSIAPVDSLAQYFDPQTSTLNPHNRGYGFYVYGTLPLFAVRYVGEWLGQTGYDEIHLVGRRMSALMDLGTVWLVYLIARRLYRNRRLALLAAAFAAFSVLPIQLSHYFAVDTFTNFFGMLAFYAAVLLLPGARQPQDLPEGERMGGAAAAAPGLGRQWGTALPYVLFGAALGLALASKINAAFLVLLLPGAALVRFFSLPPESRARWWGIYARNLALAAVVCWIVFRVFQPYAFSGPGFLGWNPNSRWVENMRELANQSTGDVDFPPALQWARRPITFALQNMVLWGLGLPLGLLAWAGFLWMGVRLAGRRGAWRQHLLLWGWTGFYFAYQSYNWTRAMRYQMLVYPTLAIIAAWAVFAVAQVRWQPRGGPARIRWPRVGAAVLGISVLVLTAAWAFAFTRIYTRPVTRVEASRWIYQNVPGPINLRIQEGGAVTNQPLAFRSGYTLRPEDAPLVMAFRPRQAGRLGAVHFAHVGSSGEDATLKNLMVFVSQAPGGENILASASLVDFFGSEADPRGKSYRGNFDYPVELDPGKTYYLTFALAGQPQGLNLAGPVTVSIRTGRGETLQALPEPVNALRAGRPYAISFTAVRSGAVGETVLPHVVDWEARAEEKTLRLTLENAGGGAALGVAEVSSRFAAPQDARGQAYVLRFPRPVQVQAGQAYTLRLEQVQGPGALAVYGSKQVNESSWDDALPLGVEGYNPYDYSEGIYRSDLNFEMYWDDNAEKLERFLTNLDQADTIFISSNRQWGTTVRLPERYPLTSEYYRQLLGCPAAQEITWCYSVAQPGMFQGKLGYRLEAVFQSDPNLGPLRFNTQFAEEAFSVYDHPKVMIFTKTADYDSQAARSILGAVDLSTAVHLTPRKAGAYPGNLLLPGARLAQQQAGGTWAELFPPDAPANRYPGLAVLLWYGAITLLGGAVFPFTRLALHGLPDRGYPFARLAGMLLLAYPVWLLSSAGVAFTPLLVSVVFAGLLGANLYLAYRQRAVLRHELRQRWKYYLAVEVLILAFFLLFLAVRLGNPDLWHAWKGGEKPMDFSYFNAVLKSTTFPPYDPWFAGGYINYYYYGFVIVGVPVKWLGITPAVAYNLILPTLFALLAAGAFSTGWNLFAATRGRQGAARPAGEDRAAEARPLGGKGPWWAGLAAALATVALGNWGTLRMVWHGIQRLAAMDAPFDQAGFITHLSWTVSGLLRLLTTPGLRLPYGPGDWYWIPSRAFTGWDITEFPAFSFLYADPHAHVIALPLTVLALAWALALLLGRWRWQGRGHRVASFLFGGLVIGALRPTNTWDWPTYLALGCVAVAYTALRYGPAGGVRGPGGGPRAKRVGMALAGVLALAGLSLLLYQPFSNWYGQGYNKIIPWSSYRTPFWSYLTHWGLFLFVIVSWMSRETVDWMAATPLSALARLRPFLGWMRVGGVALAALTALLGIGGVQIAWLALPLAAWAGILLLRPGLHDARRAVLFITGTALFLTLFVEVAVLQGDIDRMNTIFKFSLQAWTLLALSAAASLMWLLPAADLSWPPALRGLWQAALAILVAGAALFPLMAGPDKIRDRMAKDAPHTLDGMAYMAYASYAEDETPMDLSQDYRAIRWMQRNVAGSPVIVEANTSGYRWGSRFTIYTGLPGVAGWDWHQRQQRVVTPGSWVSDRVDAIGAFYNTEDRAEVERFLQRYRVKYIVVGQLERILYTPAGLQKFTAWNEGLWHEVYRDGQTVIYKVAE